MQLVCPKFVTLLTKNIFLPPQMKLPGFIEIEEHQRVAIANQKV